MTRPPRLKNVILITIDSLVYSRLGFAGGHPTCSPTLDYLARTGITCTQALTHSGTTQFSFPSIFSSSLPLDFGGCEFGIHRRPVSIAEVFQRHGYRTMAFSSDYTLNYYYGYDRGFDEFAELFRYSSFWPHSAIVRCLEYYGNLRSEGIITDAQLYSAVGPVLRRAYQYLVGYCDRKILEIENKSFSPNANVFGQDFPRMRQVMSGWLKDLEGNPASYIEALIGLRNPKEVLDPLPQPARWTDRVPRSFIETVRAAAVSPNGLQNRSANYGLDIRRLFRRTLTEPGGYLVDNLTRRIRDQRTQGFFAWVSLNDIHDGNFSDHVFSPGTFWLRLKKLWSADGSRRLSLYDLNLKYVDRLVGRIIETLKEMEIIDQTLVVICADHGRIGFRPHEDVIRVPLIFWNRRIGAQVVETQCGLMDLAPTIVDLMGLGRVPQFRGEPVYASTNKGGYVIFEHTGIGPVDLQRKVIEVSVIGERFKYIRQRTLEEQHSEVGVEELYDREADPGNAANLIDRPKFQDVVPRYRRAALKIYAAIEEGCR